MVLAAALKTWGAVQTSLSINLIEWIHPPCNMMPSPYISVLFFQLFTLASSNLWFPCHFIVQQLSLLSSHLSTSPDIQLPTHLHLIRSHQVQFLSSPYTLLLSDEYASVALHLRLMKGVLIKDSGKNTAARFGMPNLSHRGTFHQFLWFMLLSDPSFF